MKQERKTSRTAGIALLGSVAVHGAAALFLAGYQGPARREKAKQPVEIAFAVEEREESAEPAAVRAAGAVVDTDTRESTVAHAGTRARTTTRGDVSAAAAAGDAEPVEPRSESVEAHAPDVSPLATRKIDLSPLAAALTMRDTFAPRGRCESALTDAGEHCGTASENAPVAPSSDAQAVIALRKELKLAPQGDGSYTYDSPTFRATVLPDGTVDFHDKIRDLNSIAERLAGVQANTSEKRRFMQSTAALREQLAERSERHNQKRAVQALAATLARLLADGALSLLEKRTAIFGLWDDCASNESGSAAQAAIESFVRAHLPEGTALAYSSAELAQLNRRRVSRRSFDPYAMRDAGAPG